MTCQQSLGNPSAMLSSSINPGANMPVDGGRHMIMWGQAGAVYADTNVTQHMQETMQ
jgi:hypothetical protein